ncbi:MAG: hypothetical protein D6816_19805, partial [Bacteroidetes bacterium]
MKNKIEIDSDGINVFVMMNVKASRPGIITLSVFLILEIILISVLLWHFDFEEASLLVIFMLIGFAFFIGLPLKYLLWNLYGNEELIVNTKSISWSYDYGFFKTNLQTVKYDTLGTGYAKVRGDDDEELGRLLFFNYRKED